MTTNTRIDPTEYKPHSTKTTAKILHEFGFRFISLPDELMSVYPTKVREKLGASDTFRDPGTGSNADGIAAALECGTSIRFYLTICNETKQIESVHFRSNGCGYMIAAATVLSEQIIGQRLTDLHGANTQELLRLIYAELDEFPSDRAHCAETAVAAFRLSLGDFRRSTIEEFAGEKALICTCFGVSEEAIEQAVRKGAQSVSLVGVETRAGTGCGSCQMLIQEIIDSCAAGDHNGML